MERFGDMERKPEKVGLKPAVDRLFWRDEILQVIYWYRGEGLGNTISVPELQTFLPAGEELLATLLEEMVADGYLVREGEFPLPGYTFSPFGLKEGARRFADEFAGLTGQAHGECNDPQCDCKTLGPGACTVPAGHGH